ncbi:hypothetical protein, partial [Sphingomonas sp. NPDC079357]|uniref:hypothetical protein n=1 Tax=Sphingomonas sp. NPDC079357 TaxID=3364518 RepID=UPI00384BC0EF
MILTLERRAPFARRAAVRRSWRAALLLVSGMLSPAAAIGQPRPGGVAVPATPARTITSLRVEGTQRIEPETALSYTKLRQGDS